MKKKLFQYKRRKKWLQFKNWLDSKFQTKQMLSPEQDKAYRITKKLITDSESFLYADLTNLSKRRYLIVNGLRFIRITEGKIRIVDGSFKYDVSFDDKILNELKELFANNLEHRHDKLEAEIADRVEKSLDNILTDINKKV